MRILIAEDEEIERTALLKLLSTHHCDCDIQVAENGQMAVEISQQWEPDVILMDIKMPLLDGLQSSEQILKIQPYTKIIIVSSYDTFKYAQKALRIGVKDYILKPSKQHEIISTVDRVVQEAQAEKLEREKEQQIDENMKMILPIVESDLVTQLLFDYVHTVHLEESMKLFKIAKSVQFYTIVITFEAVDKQTKLLAYKSIRENLKKTGTCWFGSFSGSQIPVIVFYGEQNKSYRAHAFQFIEAVQKVLVHNSINSVIGIGSVVTKLENARSSYYEALQASAEAFGKKSYCFYSELADIHVQEKNIWLNLEKNVLEALSIGNEEKVRQHINQWIDKKRAAQQGSAETQHKLVSLFILMHRYLNEIGYDFEDSFPAYPRLDFQHLRLEANLKLDNIFNFLKKEMDKHESTLAYKFKQYIKENFTSKDMSLDTLAEVFQLTPQYISQIFRNQCDISYIDYLTKCRINYAKTLIDRNEMSLKEIALEVGYQDPNYFSRVFKRICQVSPSQYKSRGLSSSTLKH